MAKQLKSTRIGIYECNLDGNSILKGKWVKGYYGLFSNDLIDFKILPDLQEAKHAGWDFEFPVLIVSYYLGRGDLPKPLPRPPGKLTVKSAGGIIKLRRMVGIPIRRKKIPRTEVWEAVIDARGQAFKVEGHKLNKQIE